MKSKIDGIGELVEFNGVHGPFYIARAGAKPEFTNGLYYGDRYYEFCFYLNTTYNHNRQAIDVIDVYLATSGRLEGLPPRIKFNDISYIQDNIRSALMSRQYYAPKNDIPASAVPSDVIFSWVIDK